LHPTELQLALQAAQENVELSANVPAGQLKAPTHVPVLEELI